MKIWMIIILSLIGSHRVQSQQLLVNTTCLELAKPSNQQLRLTCSNPSEYHCLLDETFTKEFEVCREWKWIPGGRCAYFNSYGRGNIDERNCNRKINLTCSDGINQFSSAENTKYTACYVKKEISTSLPVTTSPTGTQSDGGNPAVNGTSDGGNATSSSNIIDRADGAIIAIPIIFGIIVPPIFIAVIYFIFMHLKYRKAKPKERQELSDISRSDEIKGMQPLLENETEEDVENPPAERHKNEESQELSDGARNNDTAEQQPTLKSETEDTSENLPTIRHEDETITEARKNGNSDSDDSADESKFFETSEELLSSPKTSGIPMISKASTETSQKDVYSEIRTEMDSDKSAEVDIAGGSKEEEGEDVQNKNKIEENSTENTSGLRTEKSDDGGNDKDESTDVFDTLESLQKEVPTTDEQGRELGKDLFNLLEEEGRKLTQEVMGAVITKETEKSVKTLLNNLTDQDKSKLTGILPEESYRILESKREHDTSFHVLYGLNQIILDEKHHPKSGWGNPVRGKDIGIGDDVERLYRIMTIVREISNPVTVSVENYVRLLDIMIEAITRLDPDGKFKEDHKALAKKLSSVINPTLRQKMFKSIREYLMLW